MKRRTYIFVVSLALAFSGVTPRAGNGKRYELVGAVVLKGGATLGEGTSTVSLSATSFPYSARVPVDSQAQFRFKNLEAGIYTLILAVPNARSVRRTIEVGPSLADSNRRVSTSIEFERRPLPNRVSVTQLSAQLSIPENARQEYQRGVEHLEKQDTERAVQCFKRALEIAPQYIGARNRLGTIAYQAGQLDIAAAEYETILNQNPNYFAALINLGGVYLALGRQEEALEINLRAEKARADEPLVQAQLGYCYFNLNRLDEALLHLKRAKDLEPGHFSFPELLLAQIYTERQDFAAGARELEEFLRLHPDSKRVPEVRKLLDETLSRQRQKQTP